MSLDPKQSLLLAFQHLDTFSVSGIGTFKKVRIPAVIDHQAGKIQPPKERFILEKGEDLVERFKDFLFRYHDLNIGDAKALAQEVAAVIESEIKLQGKCFLPGVGEIRRMEDGTRDLILDEIQSSGLAGNPFFGLPALNLTVNQAKPVPQEEKIEAAKKVSALQGAKVEAAPKPIRGGKTKPKGRGMRALVVVLLLLIMAGSAAGIIFQDKFQALMQEMGWMSSTSTTENANSQNPNDELSDGHNKGQGSNANPSPDSAVADYQPEDKVPPVDAFIPQPEESIVNPTDLAEWKGTGEYAKSGVYYLVVGARSDANGARKLAQQVSVGSIKAKVLVPRQEGPHYKVVVFQSSHKNSVIQKMVEWKDKFPEKSWIFWVGM